MRPAGLPGAILCLQSMAGNRAVARLLGGQKPPAPSVQRLVIHPDLGSPGRSLSGIKDHLETEETVETLLKQPGQEADVYGGNKPVTATNYLISHGVFGMAASWPLEEDMAENLVARGIGTGHELFLITCQIGVVGGNAETLAVALGNLGAIGVVIHAPTGYVNWNAKGPVTVTQYPSGDADIKNAEKLWVRSSDKAWAAFITGMKDEVIKELKWVHRPSTATAVWKVVSDFVAQPNVLATNVKEKRLPPEPELSDPVRLYEQIVRQAKYASTASGRDSDQRAWAATLDRLLREVNHLRPKEEEEPEAASKAIEGREAELLAALRKVWPTYSAAYFDLLRTKYDENLWRRLTSAPGPSRTIEEPDRSLQTAGDLDVDALLQQLQEFVDTDGIVDDPPLPAMHGTAEEEALDLVGELVTQTATRGSVSASGAGGGGESS